MKFNLHKHQWLLVRYGAECCSNCTGRAKFYATLSSVLPGEHCVLSANATEMNHTKTQPAHSTDATWLVGVTERARWPKEVLSKENR